MRGTRTLVSLAVSLVFPANGALAQAKDSAVKKATGPSPAETWTDPVETEKSDKGPYAPQATAEGEPEPRPPARHPKAPDPGRERDRFEMFGQVVIGFGQVPLNNPGYTSSEKGTAVGFEVGGRYDFTPAVSAGLRMPITTASVHRADGGENLGTTAFGSPELFASYRLALNRLSSVPIFFGVGIPVAEGNPDDTDSSDTRGQSKSMVNRLGDATTGWRDSELFQPKRLPLIIGGGFHHERRDWELHADAKVVLLPALSTDVNEPEADPPGTGTYVVNSFALREVTALGGSYNLLDRPTLYAALDVALVWTPIETFDFEPTAETNAPSAVQAVLEPRLGMRFKYFTPNIGYIAPLGGRLGDGGVGGVRLRLDVHL